MTSRVIGVALGALLVGGCISIAGIADFEVDPCIEGCADGPTADTGRNDGDPPGDGGTEGSADAPTDSPVPSPGLSAVTTSGTGVAVGKTGVVTLVTRSATGDVVPRAGAKVVFTATGGTSVVTFGPVTDAGGGTHRATYTGVTEGTKLNVSATLDGAPLTTPPPTLRVVNPISTNLTFSLDAANADRVGNFGGKGCPASGLVTWTDLTTNAFGGALTGFGSPPCGPAGSGWTGNGTPESPFRLAFDGVDDNVDFGAVNSLTKQTVIAWIRKNGDGFTGTSGGGGLTLATPIVTKGTSESGAAVGMNFYVGLASTGQLATDYEDGTSANSPLVGSTVLALSTWYMIAMTLDATAGERFLYVNGAQDGMSAITAAPSAGTAALLVVGGARRSDGTGSTTCPGAPGSTGCGRFNGDIAAVLTYDRALTKAEIERTCHSFSSRFGMTTCPN